jgi:mono/diheme cytochrome c family protein
MLACVQPSGFWIAALGLTLFACDQRGQQERSEPVASSPPRAQPLGADDLYAKRCVVCHGKQGKGDGPGAAALNPRPRSFADPAWQSLVTDEHIRRVIVGGGSAAGMSPAMPANPDLRNKSELVEGLLRTVRAFGG